MNAPAQILSALALAGAAAFFPLNGQFKTYRELKDAAEKRTAAKDQTGGSDTKSGAKDGTVKPAAPEALAERIPAGTPDADAGKIIAELAALDGKMLSSRQIISLLDKILSLPASRMEEARVVIQDSKNPILGVFLYSALFSRWGELDPVKAQAALEAGTGGNVMFKYAGMSSLASGWIEKDPDSLIKWLNEDKEGANKNDREMRMVMLQSVMMGMASLDSATTDKLIEAAPQHRRADMVMDMAERDPQSDLRAAAARAIVEAGDNKQEQMDVNRRLGNLLAERDPKEGIAYASELPADQRSGVYRSAMESWMQKDKPAAMKWLKEQPAEVQASAVEGMRRDIREMNYAEVTAFSSDLTPKAGQNVARMAVDETAGRNPQEALRYLPSIGDSERPGAYQEIASEWTKKDSQAASEWIDPLPPGPEKDRAITGMVNELGAKDPYGSTAWASTIGDENTRVDLVSQNAQIWLKKDPDAAREWINATDTLTEQQKTGILNGEHRTPPANNFPRRPRFR